MEQAPCPTPETDDFSIKKIMKKPQKKEIKILEENKYSIKINNFNYIFTCSRTDNDCIIFNIKLDEEIIYSYYEKEYEYHHLSKISQIFNVSENVSEAYDILIDNITNFEKEIILELNENNAILTLQFKFPTKKIKYGKIILEKKEIDLKIILNKLNTKLDSIQKNQIQIENNFNEKLNLIETQQKKIKNELDNNKNSIESIKLSNSELKNIIKNNEEIINKIQKEQFNNKNKFDKYDDEIRANKKYQLNNEKLIKNMKNNINENIEDFIDSMEKKYILIEENNKKLNNFINNNNEEIIRIDKNISLCKDSLEKANKEIILIKENHNKIKSNFDDEILKINSMELKCLGLEKNENENKENLNKELKKAFNEIEFLKNKTNEYEKNLEIFMDKLKKLEEKKNTDNKNTKRIFSNIDNNINIDVNNKEKEENKFENLSINNIINSKNNKNEVKSERNYKLLNRVKNTNYLLTDPYDDNIKEKKIEKEDNGKNNFFNTINNFHSNMKNRNKKRILVKNYSTSNFIRPHNFAFKKIISKKLFNKNYYNNRACIFSQMDKVYIVYGINRIISYDMECYDYDIDNAYILFKQLHKQPFDSCRYFYDKSNNRDLIITSSLDSHVKIIHFKKRDSIIISDLNFESTSNVIINSSFLIDDKIMIPFAFHEFRGNILFYDLKGEFISDLKDDPGFILALNGYYYENTKTNYAIVSNKEGIYVYIINNYSLYNKFIPSYLYKSTSFSEGHIIEKNEKIILLGPSFSTGHIFLWNLINKDLISIIRLTLGIMDMCIWDNNYIFASLNGVSKDFVLINLNNKEIEKEFSNLKVNCCGIHLFKNRVAGNFLILCTTEGQLLLYSNN